MSPARQNLNAAERPGDVTRIEIVALLAAHGDELCSVLREAGIVDAAEGGGGA